AKTVLAEMVAGGGSAAEIAKARGFEAVSADALGDTVDGIIAANPDEWDRYVNGDDKTRGKLTGFFVGQVMRATQGNADGKAVTALLEQRRNG
ncbi:MAG TPA: Asp-tRNA(Asn)/Glu-tRNA(Gln) amidotransferase subunit GatB, partial [Acidimicrobiales bacterium]|nr:Asp-tRNA(Asn)/Glu-tRNA(Gln) amidotransferase subunit GatB [Acidimicrobiales bacterium]